MDGGRGRFLGWCLQDEDTLWKKSWLQEEELLGGLAGVWCGECSGFVVLEAAALLWVSAGLLHLVLERSSVGLNLLQSCRRCLEMQDVLLTQ